MDTVIGFFSFSEGSGVKIARKAENGGGGGGSSNERKGGDIQIFRDPISIVYSLISGRGGCHDCSIGLEFYTTAFPLPV